MNKIINTHTHIITSPFGVRTYKGKTRKHKGIDLRSVNMVTGICHDIVAPEYCKVLRQGIDGYGNYFLVTRGIESDYELKFIHIEKTHFEIGEMIRNGHYISISRIGGNSRAHHLHFETWEHRKPLNPVDYLNKMNINYKYK